MNIEETTMLFLTVYQLEERKGITIGIVAELD